VVDRPTDILKYSSQALVIGLDECQFFSDEIIEVALKLLSQKKKLIASGLDLDYKGNPFGPVPHLLALADRVDKLCAVCRKCGSDFACRTQRLVHSSEQILVGDAQYEARCIHCFDPPADYQLQIALSQKEQPQLTLVSNTSEVSGAMTAAINNAMTNVMVP
jgi:thymidine kinase